MKTIVMTTITVLLLATGCVKENLCTRGEGPINQMTLNLDEFNSINLQGSWDVEITYGETQQVKAEGQANIIKELETNIVGGVWNINLGTGCFSDFDLKLYIQLPLLKKAVLTGSGDIFIQDVIGMENVSFENNGSGRILVSSVDGCNAAYAKLAGSGPIELSGNWPDLKFMEVAISGSGDFLGFAISVPECRVTSTGSGQCEVTVNDLLTATIKGSGNIYYMGRPEIDVDDTASGRLIHKN